MKRITVVIAVVLAVVLGIALVGHAATRGDSRGLFEKAVGFYEAGVIEIASPPIAS